MLTGASLAFYSVVTTINIQIRSTTWQEIHKLRVHVFESGLQGKLNSSHIDLRGAEYSGYKASTLSSGWLTIISFTGMLYQACVRLGTQIRSKVMFDKLFVNLTFSEDPEYRNERHFDAIVWNCLLLDLLHHTQYVFLHFVCFGEISS